MILRMRLACWSPRTTNTCPVYVTLIDFLLQQWLHKSGSILPYMYTTRLVDTYYLNTIFTQACGDPWLFFLSQKGYTRKRILGNSALQGFIDVVVIATECEMQLANNGWWIYRDGSESRFLPNRRVSKCLVLRRTTNVGTLRGRSDDSESRRHAISIFKTRQLWFRFLIR